MKKLIGRAAWQRFEELDLGRATIVEHRADGDNVVGFIEHVGSAAGSASVYIEWRHLNNLGRATKFYSALWAIEIEGHVIFLKRIAEGKPDAFDMPMDGCDLYTIFMGEPRIR
jgi:hypothetical protein